MASSLHKQFFQKPYFAVVGASTTRSKYGNKVLRWYQSNDLNVTPIHHKEVEIEKLATQPSIKELPSPKDTSISIITPPQVTLSVLKDAQVLGINNVWIQPGAEDQKVIDFAKDNKDMNIILGGSCILVEGSAFLHEARL
ncbi:CoA-binding protein [Parasitella parasitica]|nr:CoA-binding protein [Parasitella parasitica]